MRRLTRTGLLATLFLLVAILATPVMAQESTPAPATPQPLTLLTRYPAQELAIGQSVSLDLVLRAGTAQTVRFGIPDLPEGWAATFRGDGKIVLAAYVEPGTDTEVEIKVEPAADVAAGTYQLTVVAEGDRETVRLPLELVVQEKLPPALALTCDLPTLRGTPSTAFSFSVTLKNEGAEDESVNLVADAPSGFQVSFSLSGQDVTNIPVAANETKQLTVKAQAYTDVAAGSYPITVLAQGSEAQASIDLTAEVTGQAELSVTTPDGRLSADAHAGTETSLQIVVRNTGTAPARGIQLSASQPTDWTVSFEPKEIAELAGNQQIEVTAKIQPPEQAVAGDYSITVSARPEGGSSKSADLRITVLTSTLWGIVGVGLIAVAVIVVGLAVMRFGRR